MADQKDELIDEGAMQTMSVAPPDETIAPQTSRDETQAEDEQLDTALGQSMAASDPPSETQPGGGDESEAHPS